MYTGGCLFTDHASGYIFTHFQVHKNSTETINGKQLFEKELFDCGVIVQNYHTDNGVFSSKEVVLEMDRHGQSVRFSGSYGSAERAIGTVFSIARTMMIHAAIHWKDMMSTTRIGSCIDHDMCAANSQFIL
jgi:hypothetical protein